MNKWLVGIEIHLDGERYRYGIYIDAWHRREAIDKVRQIYAGDPSLKIRYCKPADEHRLLPTAHTPGGDPQVM